MDLSSQLLSYISVATALLSVLATFLSYMWRRGSGKKTLAELQESRAEAAIASSDLETLGDYIERELGEVSVGSYSADTQLQERVTRVLGSVRAFLAAPQDADQEEPPPATIEISVPTYLRLESIEERIRSGDVWDGLAALRRTMEVRLRGFAESRDIDAKRMGVGNLLRELARRDAVPPDLEEYWRYAIHVANKGVHGLDVSGEEASQALNAALRGFEILERTTPAREE